MGKPAEPIGTDNVVPIVETGQTATEEVIKIAQPDIDYISELIKIKERGLVALANLEMEKATLVRDILLVDEKTEDFKKQLYTKYNLDVDKSIQYEINLLSGEIIRKN